MAPILRVFLGLFLFFGLLGFLTLPLALQRRQRTLALALIEGIGDRELATHPGAIAASRARNFAASASLTLSNAPFKGPIGAVRVGRIGGEFVLKSKLREGTEGIAILPRNRVLESMAPVEGVSGGATRKKRAFA